VITVQDFEDTDGQSPKLCHRVALQLCQRLGGTYRLHIQCFMVFTLKVEAIC
jgi:hypothetical protein